MANGYTVTQIITALRAAGGVVSIAAQTLNMSPQAIHKRLKENSILRKAREEIREEVLDLAEAQLLNKIRAGSLPAVIFFLTKQGRSRGYANQVGIAFRETDKGPDLSHLSQEEIDTKVTALITAGGGGIFPIKQGNQS